MDSPTLMTILPTISIFVSKKPVIWQRTVAFVALVSWGIYSTLYFPYGFYLYPLVFTTVATLARPYSFVHLASVYMFLLCIFFFDVYILQKDSLLLTLYFIVLAGVLTILFRIKENVFTQISVGALLLLIPLLV